MDILSKLSAPLPPNRVSWRVGSTTQDKSKGMALAYIDSRDVQDRLDAVCGSAGWQCRYPHAGQKTVCEIGVKIGDEWIWKADGAGDTDVEQEKGALSDAFKRAAVKWGIGRYLYDVESPWVKIVQKGKSYVIDESEMPRLQRLLPGSKADIALPDSAAPVPAVPAPEKSTEPKPISAKTPEDWTEKFVVTVSVAPNVRDLTAFEKANHEWLTKLPKDLYDRCAVAMDHRIAFLSQEPLKAAAE